ncbi:MAG TPA: Nif3-like dinuclear metal center hexameric protein [Terriglobales bacterium]|nr:Nif3-like dinuclear metal center hexameric protein [Terriglobales bacterium]
MISAQQLLERIQKHVGVPWQSQRADGFSDGVLQGNAETIVTGIVTTFTPTLEVLRKAVASGKNTVICREAPFYSRGERAPLFWRNGPAPPKELVDNDTVCRAKQEFIAQNNVVILRLCENWDARENDGQLRGLARAFGWEQFHVSSKKGSPEYHPHNVYFSLPNTSLNSLAQSVREKSKIQCPRVIGDSSSSVQKVALTHGVLLVAEAERILREPVDVVVAGDAVEWEAAPYFQDLVTAKKAKGLVLIGHEASEEPGSGVMAEWLKSFISEAPIEWIPAGEPFWRLS